VAVEAGSWFEKTSTGEEQLEVWGVLEGWEDDDITPKITPLTTSVVPVQPDLKPAAPALSGSMTTQSTSTIDWVPVGVDLADHPVTLWGVGRRESLDDGVTWPPTWTVVTGSPFSGDTYTLDDTGIPTQASPQLVVQYRVRGLNAYGYSPFSYLNIQWNGNPATPPTAPIDFRLNGKTPTTRTFAWDLDTTTPSPAVTTYGIFEGDIQVVSGISESALQLR
jgi:hypothetical protein